MALATEASERDRQVQRVLWIEGAANLVVMGAKLVVGVTCGAGVVLADAVHSFADLANNGLALVASRLSSSPPDRDHPYGHRKFEPLAVFVLASLLAVLAVEVALRALGSRERSVAHHGWALLVMLGVLAVNVGLGLWQTRWARRLRSDLLQADARHTLSDAMTTVAVIAGWQLAAAGHVWLDTGFTLGVSALILFLAYDLFRRAIPILVDQAAEDPTALERAIRAVPGVRELRSVRSRHDGRDVLVEVVVSVDAEMSTHESHRVADEIERSLASTFSARDVIVHIEPDGSRSKGGTP